MKSLVQVHKNAEQADYCDPCVNGRTKKIIPLAFLRVLCYTINKKRSR